MRRIFAIVFLLGCSAMAWGASCPSGYANWYPLYILAQSGTSTDQTSFPMYFAGNAFLNSTNSLNSGLDVTFCDGNNTGNLLPYELVANTYNSSGAGEWWVKVPTVSHNTVEVIYVGVGKSGANDSNAAGVWLGFLGVWHFGTSSTLTLTDSTGNHTATNHGVTAAAGAINGAGAFVHSSAQYIDTGGVLNPGTANQISMLAWLNPTTGFETCQRVLSNLVSPTYAGYEMILGGNCVANGELEMQTATGGNLNACYTSAAISAGAWSQVAVTQNGTGGTNQKTYINGANQSCTSSGTYAIGNSTNDMAIGAVVAIAGYSFNGGIDEVEIYNGVLSADWIKDEYNNQSSPTTFYGFGTLTITTTTLPNTTTAANYNQTLAATGGTGSGYTWSINGGGSLGSISGCGGLSLSSGGVITGTPTTLGTCPFTAKVTDSGSNTATQPLSISISTAPTVSFSQSKCSSAFGSPVSLAATSNVTAGDLLLIDGEANSGATLTGVTNTGTAGSQTWNACPSPYANVCFYATASVTGSFTASVTISSGSVNEDVCFLEFSGVNTIDLHPTAGTGTGTALSVTPGAVASVAEALVGIGNSGGLGSITAGTIGGSTATLAGGVNYAATEYFVSNSLSGTQTATETLSGSHAWAMGEVSFYDVPTEATAPTPSFSYPGGSYIGSITLGVVMTCTGGECIYTTDGSTPGTGVGNCTPTGTGTAVSSGSTINISTTTTLNAITCISGDLNSAEESATYTFYSLVPLVTDNFTSYPHWAPSLAPNTTVSQPNLLTNLQTNGAWQENDGQGYIKLTNDSLVSGAVDATCVLNSSYCWDLYNGITFPANQYETVTVNSSGTNASVACVRIQAGSASGECASYGPGGTSLQLLRYASGSSTPINSTTTTVAAGSTLTIAALGSVYEILVNGALPSGWTTYTDSTYSSGQPGFVSSGNEYTYSVTMGAVGTPTTLTASVVDEPPYYSPYSDALTGSGQLPWPWRQICSSAATGATWCANGAHFNYTGSGVAGNTGGTLTNYTLTAAANASGGNTVYTCSSNCSGILSNGTAVTVTGFDNTNNNGKFLVVTSNSGTATLANPNGVLDVHAGNAAQNTGGFDAQIDYSVPFGNDQFAQFTTAQNTEDGFLVNWTMRLHSMGFDEYSALTGGVGGTMGYNCCILSTWTIANGGSGYQVGDTVVPALGSGGNASFTVASLTGSAIASLTQVTAGTNWTTGTASLSGGHGSGASITITATANGCAGHPEYDYDGNGQCYDFFADMVAVNPVQNQPFNCSDLPKQELCGPYLLAWRNIPQDVFGQTSDIYESNYSPSATDVIRAEIHGNLVYGLAQYGGTGTWHVIFIYQDNFLYLTGGYTGFELGTTATVGTPYFSNWITGTLPDYATTPVPCSDLVTGCPNASSGIIF